MIRAFEVFLEKEWSRIRSGHPALIAHRDRGAPERARSFRTSISIGRAGNRASPAR
jgi:hypothetical protein